jgi:hypothetical protein
MIFKKILTIRCTTFEVEFGGNLNCRKYKNCIGVQRLVSLACSMIMHQNCIRNCGSGPISLVGTGDNRRRKRSDEGSIPSGLTGRNINWARSSVDRIGHCY